jgi:hypothetical protein
MERGNYLAPYRSLKTSVYFKGETTCYATNFSPSTAKPGDILYIDFPSIKDELIVPGSFCLTFDMDIVLDPNEPGGDVKNYPVNNLAANIVSDIRVKIGSQNIFELNNAHLYNTYKDLWLTEKQRKNLSYVGIQDINLRKIRTDLKTSLNTTTLNLTLKNMYGKRYKLPIDFEIITDHMPISGTLLESNLTFELTINSKRYALNYANEAITNFEMKNICLEFETVKDTTLYREIERDFIAGTQFLYDHILHYKREEINKEATFVNVEIQGLDRKSLKGILLLFENDFTAGDRDSEVFINPAIKNVKYTIDGLPNKHYSSGYRESDQWREISKHFMTEQTKISESCSMDLPTYYAMDKFALWTDLRSTEDNNLHGTGKQHEAKNVIKMEITKNAHTPGKYIMHIYVVSDARIIIKDKKLASFEH